MGNELVNYDDFNKLNEKIKGFGNLAVLNLYEMCKNLKEMHDSALYEFGNYENFDDYALKELGLKKTQAYNYLKVANTYSSEFFQSTGNDIGITKLIALSSLENEEAIKNVINEVPVKEISVSELEKELNEIKSKYSETVEQLSASQNEISSLEKKVNSADKEFSKQISEKEKEIASLKNELNLSNLDLVKFDYYFKDFQRSFKKAFDEIEAMSEVNKTTAKKLLFQLLKQLELKIN